VECPGELWCPPHLSKIILDIYIYLQIWCTSFQYTLHNIIVGYWPFNAHACGFWFLPMDWQFSCDKCMELSGNINSSFGGMLCANHSSLEHFLTRNAYSSRPIFVGLSSIGRCVLIWYYSYFYSFYPGTCALQRISNKYWNYVSTHWAIHHTNIIFLF
jgi:hypothetical protein